MYMYVVRVEFHRSHQGEANLLPGGRNARFAHFGCNTVCILLCRPQPQLYSRKFSISSTFTLIILTQEDGSPLACCGLRLQLLRVTVRNMDRCAWILLSGGPISHFGAGTVATNRSV